MSTNANILYLHNNGSLDCSVDWMDGDLDTTGERLLHWYPKPSSAKALANLGEFSEVPPLAKVSGIAKSASADRSIQPLHFRNWKEYADSGEPREFDYVFANRQWYVAGDHRTMNIKAFVQHVRRPQDWLTLRSLIVCRKEVFQRTKNDLAKHGRQALNKLYLEVFRLYLKDADTLPTIQNAKRAEHLISDYEKRFLMAGGEFVADGPVRKAFEDYSFNHAVGNFLQQISSVLK